MRRLMQHKRRETKSVLAYPGTVVDEGLARGFLASETSKR